MTVLRHLPAPASEPPYDDEHAGRGPAGPPSGAVQGTLALAFVLPNGVPRPRPRRPTSGWSRGPRPRTRPTPSTSGRSRPPPPPCPTPAPGRPGSPRPSSRSSPATARCPSSSAGRRPRCTTTWPPSWSGRRAVRGAAARGVVRSIHVSEPADGVAEVAALVRRGARSTAVALRLEGLDGRWQCTALELG